MFLFRVGMVTLEMYPNTITHYLLKSVVSAVIYVSLLPLVPQMNLPYSWLKKVSSIVLKDMSVGIIAGGPG